MNSLREILSSQAATQLGWTLLHSIWQLAAIAAALALLLTALRRRSANLRYLVACVGLLAMLAAPAATCYFAWDDSTLAATEASTAKAAAAGLPAVPPPFTAQPTEITGESGAILLLESPSGTEATIEQSAAPTPLLQRVTSALSPWMPWLAAAWLVGICLLSVWNLGGWIVTRRLKRLGTTPVPADLTDRLADLAARMKIRRPVQLLASSVAQVPIALGWLRPVILLPLGCIAGIPAQQLDAILAHELAHIRRYDYLVNLLQTAVETLLFYHPAVWWLARRIRTEREHCCDDTAVEVCGSRVEYAEALASLAQSRSVPALAMAAKSDRGGSALARVRRILGATDDRAVRWSTALGGVAGALIVMVALAGYVAVADEPDPSEPEETEPAAETVLMKTYDVDGLKIEAGFLPSDSRIILGQPSFVTFKVINRSAKPYRFMIGGDDRGSVRHNNFHITAVDAQGRPVKDPYSYNNFGGMSPEITLGQGETHTERLFLGHWLAFERPGTYTVTCERTLEDYGAEPRFAKLPITSRFELKVAGFDQTEMRRVIAELGKRIRLSEGQELRNLTIALADVDDEAVVPHLIASLQRGDFQNQIPAIDGLSRFPTDVSADALREALKDRDHAVREAAGRALQKIGKAGRVTEALLKELADESAEVRTLAATALGQTHDRAALKPLIKALDDPDSAVRCAAAVSLGSLGYQEARDPLEKALEHKDRAVRVAAADGLRRLTGKLDSAWLVPVIRESTDPNDQSYHEAIRLTRIYADDAAVALIGCLDFDDPSPRHHYNFFLILAIHHCKGGPDCYYRWKHDPNTDGTPQEIANNRQILDELKAWAAARRDAAPSNAPLPDDPDTTSATDDIDRLIDAVTTRPWPGEDYPKRPPLSADVRQGIAKELRDNPKLKETYAKLDAKRSNIEWFAGIDELAEAKAVWCLASGLCHSHDDVQIRCAKALGKIGDRRPAAFMIEVAEAFAVHEPGSENATLHGIFQSALASALNTILKTNVKVLDGQDPEGLKAGIPKWREALTADDAPTGTVDDNGNLILSQPLPHGTQLEVQLDRDRMRLLGLTAAEVAARLRIYFDNNDAEPAALSHLRFKTQGGQEVLLKDFAQIRLAASNGPSSKAGETTESSEPSGDDSTDTEIIAGRRVGPYELGVSTLADILGEDTPERRKHFADQGLYFQFDQGRELTGVTVSTQKYKTVEGIHVGSTADSVVAAFGEPKQRDVTTDKLSIPGLIYDGIAFATADGKVAAIQISAVPEVDGKAAGKLEFRVVPNRIGSSRMPVLDSTVDLAEDLKTAGPMAGRQRGDEFQWFEIDAELHDRSQTATYRGRRYALLCDRAPYAMKWDGSWGLRSVRVEKDAEGRFMVVIELDDRGAKQLWALTGKNTNNALAMLIDDRAISAPTVRSPISNKGVITGNFTEKEVERIVERLKSVVRAEEAADE